ncbi:MAG: hypothetical protein RR321_05975 [Acidaminococcaceae bacterium]
MMSKFQVTLNSHCHYGYTEYDEDTKMATVVIEGAPEAVQKVEEYLRQPQTMDLPGENIRAFSTWTLDPLADLETFKTVLTRLWVSTDVRVEWSIPVGSMDKL